jgi:hypothetical protein
MRPNGLVEEILQRMLSRFFQGTDKVYMIYLSRSHSPCLCHRDGASSISAASLMIRPMYLDFVKRILMFWSWM